MIPAFVSEYGAAVEAFVKCPDEEARGRAYELGRVAITQGLGVLDLSRVHGLALEQRRELASDGLSAWQFFSEVLAPFEMALRGVRDANATLKRFNEALEERVTDRTGALRAIEKQLREQTALLTSVVESMDDGVAAIDARGQFTLVNRRGSELFGEVASDASAVSWHAQGALLPDERTPLRSADHPLVRASAGEVVRDTEIFVRNSRFPDGVHLSVSASPIYDETGLLSGAVAVLRDTTARRRAEDAARKAEDRLMRAQKLDAVGQLAGGVAHDFNNLLAVILSYCNLLADDIPTEHPHAADLREIQRAGNSAAALTRQLLAFSRQQVLQPLALDLNDVVAELVRMLKRTLGEHIDLATALAPDLAAVLADRGQVEQVLMNLAVNARDAMASGGKLTIETRNVLIEEGEQVGRTSLVMGQYALLSVTDTGTGMDEATRARIFEPFFTTKERGRGTGLGLATVYGIVQQSGGQISVYSEVGRGTTFRVYLPVTVAAAARRLPGVPRPETRGTETLLLVEDEEQVRTVATRVLSATGYFVLAASGPTEARALSSAHRGDIQLLVTDIVMPGGSGPELAKELSRARPAMRVLYTSGYAAGGVTHHGSLPPDAAFLEKPFTADTLRERVRQVLEKR